MNLEVIKKFHKYNESVRDKMTPKSEEEIKLAIAHMDAYNKFNNIFSNGFSSKFPFEELKLLFDEISNDRKADLILKYDLHRYHNGDLFTKNEVYSYLEDGDVSAFNTLVLGLKMSDLDIVKLAVKKDKNVINNRSYMVMGNVVRGDVDIVKYLIPNGLDVLYNDSNMLQQATIEGNTEMVELLLKAGSYPNKDIIEIALNKYDYVPEIVELLFQYTNPKVIKLIERWGYKYRGHFRPKDAYPYLEKKTWP